MKNINKKTENVNKTEAKKSVSNKKTNKKPAIENKKQMLEKLEVKAANEKPKKLGKVVDIILVTTVIVQLLYLVYLLVK